MKKVLLFNQYCGKMKTFPFLRTFLVIPTSEGTFLVFSFKCQNTISHDSFSSLILILLNFRCVFSLGFKNLLFTKKCLSSY